MSTFQVLLLGLVNWLATTIIVDGVIFAPLRARIARWSRPDIVGRGGIGSAFQDAIQQMADLLVGRPRKPTWREKVAYLVNCQLCAGVWVGLLIGAVAGGPFDVPFVGWILSGLAYKAIGHLVLDIVAVLNRLAEPAPRVEPSIVVVGGDIHTREQADRFRAAVRGGRIGHW